VSVERLFQRADAVVKLIRAGELEPWDGFEVVLWPSPELLELEEVSDADDRGIDSSREETVRAHHAPAHKVAP
jgi:hypothetical protein